MLEVIWTRRAEDHVQRIFAKLDEYSPQIAESWLEAIGKRAELLCRRGLGLFYVIEGRRLIVSGIFPLHMDPATILRRLEDSDWV